MDQTIIMGLVYNAALLITLALIYIAVYNKPRVPSRGNDLMVGLVGGLAGVLIMYTAVGLSYGGIFDARSILISTLGLFFGGLPTVVAGTIMAAYRILLGGPGAIIGILVIVATGTAGVLWRKYRFQRLMETERSSFFEFMAFGLMVHLIFLLSASGVPPEYIRETMEGILFPVLLVYPLGTALLCVLFKNHYQKVRYANSLRESNDRINKILEGANAGTWEWNVQTGEQIINERWAEIIGYTLEELSPVSARTWMDNTHPEDLTLCDQILKEVFERRQEYYELEFRMKHKDGHWVWVASRGRVNTWTKEGKPLLISGTHMDVTKNRLLEEEVRASRTQLHDILEFFPDAVLAINLNREIILWNKAMEEMTGVPAAEMMGKGDYAYTVPFYGKPRGQLMDLILEQNPDIESKYQNLKWVGKAIEGEAFAPAIYEGKGAWIQLKVAPLHDQEGNIIGVIESIRDINAKHQSQEELIRSEERFRIMFEEAPLGIGLFDLFSGRVTQVNKKFLEIIGFDKEDMDDFRWMDVSHPDDMAKNNEYRNRLLQGEITGFNMRKRYFRKDGIMIWINLTISLLDPLDTENPRELCMIEDITEKVKWDEEIQYLTTHDALTGLYNRFSFEQEKVDMEEGPLPLSVLIADVDGLKLINDGFGYSLGDQLLQKAAEIFRQACRPGDKIFRIGGDEFCILMPKAPIEEARLVSSRIEALCEEAFIHVGSNPVKVSISVGSGVRSNLKDSLSGIIISAENAMRRKKLLGRKSVRSDLIASINATMLEKSHETAEHADRLVQHAKAIGEHLMLPEATLFDLELATALHDIGKMSVDERILLKKETLTPEEWGQIRKHPEAGYRIAQATTELMPIADFILAHHERWDGNGYPRGLKGEEIPLIARIINIVDSYDAMTSQRPYGKPLAKEKAIAEMERCAGTQFDPDLVRVFLEKVLEPEEEQE